MHVTLHVTLIVLALALSPVVAGPGKGVQAESEYGGGGKPEEGSGSEDGGPTVSDFGEQLGDDVEAPVKLSKNAWRMLRKVDIEHTVFNSGITLLATNMTIFGEFYELFEQRIAKKYKHEYDRAIVRAIISPDLTPTQLAQEMWWSGSLTMRTPVVVTINDKRTQPGDVNPCLHDKVFGPLLGKDKGAKTTEAYREFAMFDVTCHKVTSLMTRAKIKKSQCDFKAGIIGGMGSLAGASFMRKLAKRFDDPNNAERIAGRVNCVEMLSNPRYPTKLAVFATKHGLQMTYQFVTWLHTFLQRGDFDTFASPCNTFHQNLFRSATRYWSKGRQINMIREVAKHIINAQRDVNVGLLGTVTTTKGVNDPKSDNMYRMLWKDVMRKVADKIGVRTKTIRLEGPRHADEAPRVQRAIWAAKAGRMDKARKLLRDMFRRMRARGITLVIGACTEIGLAVDSDWAYAQKKMSFIDTSDILADAVMVRVRLGRDLLLKRRQASRTKFGVIGDIGRKVVKKVKSALAPNVKHQIASNYTAVDDSMTVDDYASIACSSSIFVYSGMLTSRWMLPIPQCRKARIIEQSHWMGMELANGHQAVLSSIRMSKDRVVLIVSFRGSDDVRDFVSGAQVVRRRLPIQGWTGQPCRRQMCGKAHKGYVDVYEHMRDQTMGQTRLILNDKSMGYNISQVIVAGHSMGATFAEMFAVDIIYNKIVDRRMIKLITFGQPSIGNAQYRDFVRSLLSPEQVRRFVGTSENGLFSDLVPSVLPGHQPFPEVKIRAPKEVANNPLTLHLVRNYCNALDHEDALLTKAGKPKKYGSQYCRNDGEFNREANTTIIGNPCLTVKRPNFGMWLEVEGECQRAEKSNFFKKALTTLNQCSTFRDCKPVSGPKGCKERCACYHGVVGTKKCRCVRQIPQKIELVCHRNKLVTLT